MTISYNLDVSQANWTSLFKIFFRWRGSLWKAVLFQLAIWTFFYLIISVIYRFGYFESLALFLDKKTDSYIPLTFMLGFFVSLVVNRWSSILNEIGWIDNSALCFATFIRGDDVETRMLKRTLIRYMVLNQVMVLRDISMQVRKRFPTLETLVAAGILTNQELNKITEISDIYSRYWTPIQWCNELIYEARLKGKISSDHILEKILHVPIPLLYPQVVFFSVRLYFIICLFGRQFIVSKNEIDLWLPINTMIQFVVYVGWMKVAEALLNPLGEDDDDLECNYIIDKNFITGLTLADRSNKKLPDLTKDMFWDSDHISPLYSLETANRTVHPFVGSASQINLVEKKKNVTMIPHKSKLCIMNEAAQESTVYLVDVNDHNQQHKSFKNFFKKSNPDNVLENIRQRHKTGALNYKFFPEPKLNNTQLNGKESNLDCNFTL